jgi:hypothetical protein
VEVSAPTNPAAVRSMDQPHPTISLRALNMRLLCAVLEPGTPIYMSDYMAWLEREVLNAVPTGGAQLLAVIHAGSQGNTKTRMRALEQCLGIVTLDDSCLSIATPMA